PGSATTRCGSSSAATTTKRSTRQTRPRACRSPPRRCSSTGAPTTRFRSSTRAPTPPVPAPSSSSSTASTTSSRSTRARAPTRRCGTRSAGPAVRDRSPPVAAERLRAQLHSRRRLAALVLGAIDHRERALDHVRVESVLRQLLARPVELHVGLEHPVELRVRRQRVLVELVRAQLGARGAVDDRLRDQLAARLLVQVVRQAEDVR